jgi:hypothetical protein
LEICKCVRSIKKATVWICNGCANTINNCILWRMSSSGMLCRVDILLTDNCSRWFIARRFLIPCRWRRYVPPKRRLTKYVHCSTSQNTTFFIDTAVKTSNLTIACVRYRFEADGMVLDAYKQRSARLRTATSPTFWPRHSSSG